MFNFLPPDFTITIVIFYWAYLILVAIYLVMGFFCLYHLIRFGFLSAVNISVILIFMAVSAWLIWYSLTILSGFDWSIPIFDGNWFGNMGGILNFSANPTTIPVVLPKVKF